MLRLVETQKHCLQLVHDEEFCVAAEKIFMDQKIDLVLDEVNSLEGGDMAERVKLKSGKEIKTDMVIIGIGSKSNIDLAECIPPF